MTRATSARAAGIAFLVYIAAGLSALALSGWATRGAGIAATLASVARHTAEMRAVVPLNLLGACSALVLAVTLYRITRDEDHELAMLGLAFRVGEGVLGVFPVTTLGLLWLATAAGPSAPDAAAASALGAFLERLGVWQATTSAILFAIGSTIFAWLFLRGRMLPAPLAWLGVAASVLLVLILPARLAGVVRGQAAQLVWLPMLVFEVWLALVLIARGAAMPARR